MAMATMVTMMTTCSTREADNGTGATAVTTAAATSSLSPSSSSRDQQDYHYSRNYSYYQSLLPSQLLICFQNRTFVWNNDYDDDVSDVQEEEKDSQISTAAAAAVWNAVILSFISERTGWPLRYLQLQLPEHSGSTNSISTTTTTMISTPTTTMSTMIRVTAVSRILGGKGGFGTLLKNSSRQSKTVRQDFGACRDLQGRRLRHVNDAAGYQQWKEWHDKVAAGTATEEEMARALLFGTDSGVAGWHLQLPTWGDSGAGATKQVNRQHQNQLRLWKRDKLKAANVKEEQKQVHERAVQSYVTAATATSARVQESLQTAIQQGLQSQLEEKKTAVAANKRTRLEPDPPAAFCTLAGELVIELAAGTSDTTAASKKSAPLSSSSSSCWQMQGTSNFATMGMILNQATTKVTAPATVTAPTTTTGIVDYSSDHNYYYYYEVRIVTGGLAQIGWATAPNTTATATAAAATAATGFRPNSDNGEGVGDDVHSWAYDPSRELFLHNGKEQALKRNKKGGAVGPAKAGDVIGCAYYCNYSEPPQVKRVATVQFYCNGELVGKKMDIAETSIMLYPAISCNQGEILELRVNRDTLSYLPKGAQPVGELLARPEVLDEAEDGDDDKEEEKESPSDSKPDENDTNQDSKIPALEPEPTKLDPVVRKAPPVQVTPEALDLASYTSVEELQSLGLDRLKAGLMAAGLKCGGTLEERAARLLSIKGLSLDQYPAKLLAKRKNM